MFSCIMDGITVSVGYCADNKIIMVPVPVPQTADLEAALEMTFAPLFVDLLEIQAHQPRSSPGQRSTWARLLRDDHNIQLDQVHLCDKHRISSFCAGAMTIQTVWKWPDYTLASCFSRR